GTWLKSVFQLFHARTDAPRLPRRLRSVAETPGVLHEKDSQIRKKDQSDRGLGKMCSGLPRCPLPCRGLSPCSVSIALFLSGIFSVRMLAHESHRRSSAHPLSFLTLVAGDYLFGTLRKYRIEGRCQ